MIRALDACEIVLTIIKFRNSCTSSVRSCHSRVLNRRVNQYCNEVAWELRTSKNSGSVTIGYARSFNILCDFIVSHGDH